MPRLGIEPGGGLVEDHQLRVVDQGPGDGQPALHASGERVDQGFRPVRELGEFEQLGGTSADVGTVHVVIAPEHVEVLGDRQLQVEVVLLGHHADPATDLSAFGCRVQAENGELPLGDRAHRRDHPHGGGLAGAVGPEETECLPFGDVEVNGVDRGEIVESLGEATRLDDRFGHVIRR